MHLAKLHGTGNDFLVTVVADAGRRRAPTPRWRVCDRHRGRGADGLIALAPGSRRCGLHDGAAQRRRQGRRDEWERYPLPRGGWPTARAWRGDDRRGHRRRPTGGTPRDRWARPDRHRRHGSRHVRAEEIPLDVPACSTSIASYHGTHLPRRRRGVGNPHLVLSSTTWARPASRSTGRISSRTTGSRRASTSSSCRCSTGAGSACGSGSAASARRCRAARVCAPRPRRRAPRPGARRRRRRGPGRHPHGSPRRDDPPRRRGAPRVRRRCRRRRGRPELRREPQRRHAGDRRLTATEVDLEVGPAACACLVGTGVGLAHDRRCRSASLHELALLADTAGAEPMETRPAAARRPDPATYVGRGQGQKSSTSSPRRSTSTSSSSTTS